MTTNLTVQQILYGPANREAPDEIDRLILGEYVKAGDQGLTWFEVCTRLLGRDLTPEEEALVNEYEADTA
jgi:hypothetical protein